MKAFATVLVLVASVCCAHGDAVSDLALGAASAGVNVAKSGTELGLNAAKLGADASQLAGRTALLAANRGGRFLSGLVRGGSTLVTGAGNGIVSAAGGLGGLSIDAVRGATNLGAGGADTILTSFKDVADGTGLGGWTAPLTNLGRQGVSFTKSTIDKGLDLADKVVDFKTNLAQSVLNGANTAVRNGLDRVDSLNDATSGLLGNGVDLIHGGADMLINGGKAMNNIVTGGAQELINRLRNVGASGEVKQILDILDKTNNPAQVQEIVNGLLSSNPTPQILQDVIGNVLSSDLSGDVVQAFIDTVLKSPIGTQAQEIISSLVGNAQDAISSVTDAAAQNTGIAGNLLTNVNTQAPGVLSNLGTAATQAPGVLSNLVGTAATQAPGLLSNLGTAATQAPGLLSNLGTAATQAPGLSNLVGTATNGAQTGLGSLLGTGIQAASNVVPGVRPSAQDLISGLRNTNVRSLLGRA